jgi:hypothetical protein
MERIFLLTKVTLPSGAIMNREALVDSGSEVNMVPSLLAKQAGWNLLPYQIFTQTVNKGQLRNEGVAEVAF